MVVSVKMVKMRIAVLVVFLAISVCAIPGRRVRRGYNNGGGYETYESGGYGRRSDERDTSGSEEEKDRSCGGQGYSERGYGGGRELSFSRDGRPSGETHGRRSFIKSSASAVSAATAFNLNQKSNIV